MNTIRNVFLIDVFAIRQSCELTLKAEQKAGQRCLSLRNVMQITGKREDMTAAAGNDNTAPICGAGVVPTWLTPRKRLKRVCYETLFSPLRGLHFSLEAEWFSPSIFPIWFKLTSVCRPNDSAEPAVCGGAWFPTQRTGLDYSPYPRRRRGPTNRSRYNSPMTLPVSRRQSNQIDQ